MRIVPHGSSISLTVRHRKYRVSIYFSFGVHQALGHIIKLFFGPLIMGSVLGSLFMVEIDVKDDFLLKNEVLLSKNVIFVFTGKCPKIQRKCSKNIKMRFNIF